MPISVTCQCGARLEIDEKFVGKDIPCPDCNRPLPTAPPTKPPPLELPDNRRVSGLAVLSLTLAIVGAFTPATIAAIVVGLLALRSIARAPNKLEGAGIARAGIITGAVMAFLTTAMLFSPTVLGLDMYLRMFKYASRMQYSANKSVEGAGRNDIIIVNRPGESWQQWGAYQSNNQNPTVMTDELIMINIPEDAFIACQSLFVGQRDNGDEKQVKALERFKKSELLHLMNGGPFEGDLPTPTEVKNPGGPEHEVVLDVRIGGKERRVLLHLSSQDGIRLNILVACAPRNRFERLESEFREAFKSRRFQ